MGGKREPRDESVMREKRTEVKAKGWHGHRECQCRTGRWGGDREEGGTEFSPPPPPPGWEVVYIRSEYGGPKAGHVS